MKALHNGKLILGDSIDEGKILLFNNKIVEIIDESQLVNHTNLELIDAKGNYISPGFIDIHIHGSGGCDTMDGNIDALNIISKTIIKNGTTAFLPTTMTMDIEDIHNALDVIRQGMNIDMEGAQVLGAHMEGPFINAKFKGAQNEIYVLSPHIKYLEDYLDVIKIITMAPEVEGGIDFIDRVLEMKEIVLSIGHTNASYEEAMEAIKRGIRHATHTFNAMTPLHHRNPGVVGAIFNSNITCELIADKIHIHPELFKLLMNIKGKDKLILITDAMRAGCMKDGEYDLGGQKVIVNGGSARLENGSLAGSILTINKAIKNFKEATGLPLNEVIQLSTLNPAKLLSVDNVKGSLDIGKDADIIIFDENIEIQKAYVQGEEKYNR